MNFKTYDILSSLIPGFILLLGILNVFNLKYDKDLVVAYTAIAFLLGYVLNTLGSWLEDFYYFTWGGKPSNNLLEGKCIWKVRIYNFQNICQHLQQRATGTSASKDELFSIAMRYANGEKDSRVEDFNANYAFARTLLTATFIGGGLVLIENYNDWRYYAVLIPIVFITWLRCKQRGYYFAREVLNVYCKSNNI